MKKRVYLISLIAILAISGTIFYVNKQKTENSIKAAVQQKEEVKSTNDHTPKVEGNSIILTTTYFDNDTKNTVWTYKYTDKYDQTKHQWDFKNTDLYVLRNGKWETTPFGEVKSPDNTASVRLPKKSTGAYHIEVSGSQNTHGRFFNDKFDIDCSKIK